MNDKIIPAIDLIEGKCVRLRMGNYSSAVTYSNNPADVALRFADLGFTRLHMVDLDGAKSERPLNLNSLKKVTAITSLKVQFGGGIKSVEVAQQVLECGASSIIVGSIAVKSPEILRKIIESIGRDRVILGVDVNAGKIYINGWETHVNNDINKFISNNSAVGISRLIYTDISKDGMLMGPSLLLYKQVKEKFPNIEITASGGIASLQDIEALLKMGADKVIVGKALYEKKIDLKLLKQWMQNE